MILVVDNYDSFTYNLVQLLWSRDIEVIVLRNDAESAAEMLSGGREGSFCRPAPEGLKRRESASSWSSSARKCRCLVSASVIRSWELPSVGEWSGLPS